MESLRRWRRWYDRADMLFPMTEIKCLEGLKKKAVRKWMWNVSDRGITFEINIDATFDGQVYM